jgi:hypothetical protein
MHTRIASGRRVRPDLSFASPNVRAMLRQQAQMRARQAAAMQNLRGRIITGPEQEQQGGGLPPGSSLLGKAIFKDLFGNSIAGTGGAPATSLGSDFVMMQGGQVIPAGGLPGGGAVGAGAGSSGAAAGSPGVGVGAYASPLAIAALIAGGKMAESKDPNGPMGKIGQTFLGPSLAQIGADPKVGLTTILGVPFLNSFIMSDKAKGTAPEWAGLFGGLFG